MRSTNGAWTIAFDMQKFATPYWPFCLVGLEYERGEEVLHQERAVVVPSVGRDDRLLEPAWV